MFPAENGDDDERIRTWIYKGSRKAQTYLYLPQPGRVDHVPTALLEAMGALELVMEIELHRGRRLARADVDLVMRDLKVKGFHLQLPPVDIPATPRVH